MTPERWQQIKGVLAGALEQPNESSRASYLQATCREDAALQREVESLLDQPADDFDWAAETIGFVNVDPFAAANSGRRVGAYELIRELGRGGMGTVWLARRADQHFEKLVAVKLLKRGIDTDEVLSRFHAERQILARLDHPNIARLLDAGTTDDGLPYFVMEYVDGDRLTDFVRAKKLSLGSRLSLFLKISNAVQFAHQNLVVHRDLKPGNILVTADGEPKLLDFGVAKLLAHGDEAWQMTMAGRQRFTPGYASPEQVCGGAITTVSDVYSLGALLYEILTGISPHRFPTSTPTASQIERVVCEEELPRPSTVAFDPDMRRHLRGDLDNILLRALAKDPARRYRGAGNLADDLRRYLDNRPVRARPDTFGYRSGKFLRRNKTATAAALLVALALIGGSITTFWQARRANRRFNDVRKIANSLMFELHDSIKDIPGALRARQLVTRRGLEYLDSLAQETDNDLSLKSELATAYDKIGGITFDVKQAIESHQKAAALNEALVRSSPKNISYRQQLSDSCDALSDVMIISGHSRQAIAYARLALQIEKGLAAESPSDAETKAALAGRYMSLGIALSDSGNYRDALDADLTAMSMQEIIAQSSSDPERRLDLAGIYGRVSNGYEDLGDMSTALSYNQKAIDITAPIFQSDPSNTRYRRSMWSEYLRTGRQLATAGNLDAASLHATKARELMESLSGADPEDTGHRRWLAVTYTTVGDILAERTRFDEARNRYEQAIQIQEQLVQKDPERVEAERDLTKTYEALGLLLSRMNQAELAQKNLTKAEAIAQASVARDPDNLRIREHLAKLRSEIAAANH